MSDTLSREKGFSLTETLLAMMLLMMVIITLAGYQRGLANGFIQLSHYRQGWRDAWRYSQLHPPDIPGNGRVSRRQTSAAECVSITVTITIPVDKRVQMTRLHCPVSQQAGEKRQYVKGVPLKPSGCSGNIDGIHC